jgi:hypothetical protein
MKNLMSPHKVVIRATKKGYFVDRGEPQQFTYGKIDGEIKALPVEYIYNGSFGTGYYSRKGAIAAAHDWFEPVEIFFDEPAKFAETPIFYLFDENDEHSPSKPVTQLSEAPERIRHAAYGDAKYYVSSWLAIHDDTSAFELPEGYQRITPIQIQSASQMPVVISEVDGAWKIHELKLGVSFEIDLLERHALIPKAIALQFLKDQNCDAVENWVHRQWNLFPNNPVLAWKVEEISRP